MRILKKLHNTLAKAYMKGPVSFIVMNNYTAYNLMKEIIGCDLPYTVKLHSVENLEVLLSESLINYEFRTG